MNADRETTVKLLVWNFSCSPADISELLGVSPTETWKPGDAVKSWLKNVHHESGWMLKSQLSPETEPDKAVLALLSMFPRREAFGALPSGTKVQLQATLYGITERPGLYLSEQAVRELAEIGATIDIDVYDFSESSKRRVDPWDIDRAPRIACPPWHQSAIGDAIMRAEIQDFGTGWFQIYLRLRPDEIDGLVAALQRLQRERHFHLMSEFQESSGVADIEISLQGDDEISNMFGSYSGARPTRPTG